MILIEYQLPRGIMNYSKCLPLPLCNSNNNNPFLDTRTSANHDKEGGHSANGGIFIKGNKTLL